MASKKELQAQLAALTAEVVDLHASNVALRANKAGHERREAERAARERKAEQMKRREAEHKARRERLDQLGAGLLPIEGATSYAFIHEGDGESGLKVFVPLDAEERRIVEGFLDARNQPKASQITASIVDEINKMAQRFTVPQVFLTGQP